ncbi:MAG: GT2 family glycosyltransferase [Ilumatobacter sp.]|jgi:N-acetylglucosaminyl-diphospho-decaprenol L-rhamnosyltransferase
MQAAVVVLTFDAEPGMLEATVDSVFAASPSDVDLIVVDNGKSARSRLSRAGTLDRIQLLESVQNGGYGPGMNLGIGAALEAGADVVILLNDDVVVADGWVEPLLDEFRKDDKVGAVQPLLTQYGSDTVNSAGVVIDDAGAGSDRLRGIPVSGVDHHVVEVEAFTGGAVAIRREFVADVGTFDERFFLYYEDVELARRGRRSSFGWVYLMVPASRVAHHGSATASALGDEMRRLQERNRLWSSAMNGSGAEIARGLWLSIRRVRHAPQRVHMRALITGLGGMPIRLLQRCR